jgi:23S rRNA (uracil1939-C5)-methyltransferase
MPMRRKKESVIIENLEILEIAAEGKCIARYNDKVIFVENVAPQDIVDVKLTKNRKSFANGIPIKFHSYSKLREKPFCEHFGICGGCKWQHISYQVQIDNKTKQVKDNFERIGKVSFPEIRPIISSEKREFYRNKLEYTFSNKRWLSIAEINEKEEAGHNALGFHIPGRFDKIVDIQNCYLQPEPSNSIRLELKKFAQEKGLSFFDLRGQEGFLRNLIIRTANSGEVMVIVQFFHNDQDNVMAVLNHLKNRFPKITSLQYVINSKGNETFHDQELITFSGKDHIIENMEDLKFKIGPKSFYQTNSDQAYVLYKVVRDFASLKGEEIVYDLYTGTGTIANFLARNTKKIIGVEYVPMAIEDAKANAVSNQITNAEFFAGDIKDVLNDEFVYKHGKPDLIIVDPPRAGLHADVAYMLLHIAPEKIVYVSCNPATQARDLAILDAKYEIMQVQPVDMFPHTHHVENVVLLQLRHWAIG